MSLADSTNAQTKATGLTDTTTQMSNQQLSDVSGNPVSGTIAGAFPNLPGVPNVSQILRPFETLLQWLTNPGRIVKLVAGAIILFIVVYAVVEPRAVKVIQTAANNAAALGT